MRRSPVALWLVASSLAALSPALTACRPAQAEPEAAPSALGNGHRSDVVPAQLQDTPRIVHNASAAATSGVDAIVSGGAEGLSLSGAGVLLGQWDQAGARISHADLRGRVLVLDAAGAADHATHVAATMVGNGSTQVLARGMAPGARLWSFGWELDLAEMRSYAPYLALSAHAYGFVMGWADNPRCPDRASWMGRADEREDRRFGKYGPEAAALDELIYETGLLTVWAGGNERQDAGAAEGEGHYHFPDCQTLATDGHDAELALQHDTLGLQLAAKNGLVVGAVGHVTSEPVAPEEIVTLAFSGYGPMDDGRIKPELVASGELVLSAVARADDAHQSFSGTSSSAAVVSGGIALLSEHHRALFDGADPPLEQWKALLVHTAVSPSPTGAPDYRRGYGLFDARAAAQLLSAEAARSGQSRQLVRGSVGADETIELQSDATAPGEALRVSLAWLDPPGSVNDAGVDDRGAALVNDLDVVLVSPQGTLHHAWSLDPAAPDQPATRQAENRVDNLEVVDVGAQDNAQGGAWRVRVSLAGQAYRQRPQAFALVSSVGLSRPSTPQLVAPRSIWLQLPAAGASGQLSLSLRNQNPGELSWSARSRTPWLTLGTASGVTPFELMASVDVAALTGRGPHLARVVIDVEAGVSHEIGVVVEVACSPDCSARECGLDPVCGETCGGCAAGEACDVSGSCVPLDGASCPSADLGSQLSPALVTGSTQAASADRAGSCGGEGGEYALRWQAPADGHYRLSAQGSGETLLHVRQACDGEELSCVAEVTTVPMSAGQALVAFVDGSALGGGFVFGAQRVPCPDVELGSRLGAYLAEGSTSRLAGRVMSSCGGSGSEAAFGWQAPAAGSYVFRLPTSSTGSVLAVRDGACDGAELGCSDQGSLELELQAGQRVVLLVDSQEGSEGRFALGVASAAGQCVGRCDGSPNRGGCHCDPACVELGDCCADACDNCGNCCQPQCDDKQCGDDGCGGSCGACGQGELCDGWACVADPCVELDDGEACDDGDACTEDDRCVGGRCAGTAFDCQAACSGDDCEALPDAGGETPEADAGRADDDAGPPLQDAGDAEPATKNDGCGCSVPGSRRPPSLLWLMPLAWSLHRLRRRARAL